MEHRRHRHADARVHVPDAVAAQAASRDGHLRLREGGLRRLPGLRIGARLLDRVLPGGRRLSHPHQIHARHVRARVRRRRHRDGDCRGVGAAVGRARAGAARRQAGGGPQHDRHRRQDHSARSCSSPSRSPVFARTSSPSTSGAARPRRCRTCSSRRVTRCSSRCSCSSASKARASIRATRRTAGCRHRHRARLPGRAGAAGAGDDAVVRRVVAFRPRDPAEPVAGGCDGGAGRPLGRRLHQRGTAHFGRRQLPVVLAARRGGAGVRRARRHDARVPGRRESPWRAGRGAVGDEHRHPGLPARDLLRRVRVQPGPQDDERDDAHSVPSGSGLRLQARVDAGDVRNRSGRARQGCRDRRAGHPVCAAR